MLNDEVFRIVQILAMAGMKIGETRGEVGDHRFRVQEAAEIEAAMLHRRRWSNDLLSLQTMVIRGDCDTCLVVWEETQAATAAEGSALVPVPEPALAGGTR